MHSIDIGIIVLYAAGIVILGCWSGLRMRRRRPGGGEAEGYFLAGGTLGWPVIGMALFATNISTIHLIGLAQAGYESGLLMGNFELMAGFTLVILALFFAPFYIRSKVATLPDFLEKRYSRGSRNIAGILSVFSAVFIHIGFSLYTGGVVLHEFFGLGITKEQGIVIIATLTGIYTIAGGLIAVVVTESVQTIVLLAGTFVITGIAYMKVGGWGEIQAHVPEVNLTLLRGAGAPGGLPWYSILLGYPVIGVWYWCTDQTIVQRVLGARDENHARVGALFAGFIKILPLFVIVLPGVLCAALIDKGILDGAKLSSSEQVYPFLIKEILPAGLKGLLAAALLSAIMSTVAGALNSIGTLVSYDLLKSWRPQAGDRALVRTGRLTAALALGLAIWWSIQLDPEGIFVAINKMIAYVAPPITCVFVLGIFVKRVSSIASMVTLVVGSILGVIFFFLDYRQQPDWMAFASARHIDFMLLSFGLFVFCAILMTLVSVIAPHRHTDESLRLVWKSPLEPFVGDAWPGIGNYKVLSLLLVLALTGVYVWLG